MPRISTGANMEIIMDISGSGVYLRDDVGGFAAGKLQLAT